MNEEEKLIQKNQKEEKKKPGRKLNETTTQQIYNILVEHKDNFFSVGQIMKLYQEKFNKKIYYYTVVKHLKKLKEEGKVKEMLMKTAKNNYFFYSV